MVDTTSIKEILRQAASVEAELSRPVSSEVFTQLSRRYAAIQPLARAAHQFLAATQAHEEAAALLTDPKIDPDIRALAGDERDEALLRINELEHEIALLTMPGSEDDGRNTILEVRAGTGGDEAALFAGDLIRMYLRFAELRGWSSEMLSASDGTFGGFREAIVAIRGTNVFRALRYESGVHRVQRVPRTEASGRIHTSAATVAVLPEPDEVDIEILDKDLRIESFRASGAGGQHVNKTDSAVRITHLPSGIVISQQSERSQHRNRAAAMRILTARLYQRSQEAAQTARAENRRNQVGRGDRSERVRTYNFPQNRVTEHRINLTLHSLTQVLAGEGLAQIVEALLHDAVREAIETAGDHLATIGN